jgi:hypothetical protein
MPFLLAAVALSGMSFVGGFATGAKSTSLLTTAAVIGAGYFLILRK